MYFNLLLFLTHSLHLFRIGLLASIKHVLSQQDQTQLNLHKAYTLINAHLCIILSKRIVAVVKPNPAEEVAPFQKQGCWQKNNQNRCKTINQTKILQTRVEVGVTLQQKWPDTCLLRNLGHRQTFRLSARLS